MTSEDFGWQQLHLAPRVLYFELSELLKLQGCQSNNVSSRNRHSYNLDSLQYPQAIYSLQYLCPLTSPLPYDPETLLRIRRPKHSPDFSNVSIPTCLFTTEIMVRKYSLKSYAGRIAARVIGKISDDA